MRTTLRTAAVLLATSVAILPTLVGPAAADTNEDRTDSPTYTEARADYWQARADYLARKAAVQARKEAGITDPPAEPSAAPEAVAVAAPETVAVAAPAADAPAATPREGTPTNAQLASLRMCESTDRYGINTGNGYYGAYQFSPVTWWWLGYSGYPNEASAAVQDQAARDLYAIFGWSPWPACSRYLGFR